MDVTVVTYNATGAVARSGSYEYPKPSGRSASTTSHGSGTAHKHVKITLPKTSTDRKAAKN